MKITDIRRNENPGFPAWLIIRDDGIADIVRTEFLASETVPVFQPLLAALCERDAERTAIIRELIDSGTSDSLFKRARAHAFLDEFEREPE